MNVTNEYPIALIIPGMIKSSAQRKVNNDSNNPVMNILPKSFEYLNMSFKSLCSSFINLTM